MNTSGATRYTCLFKCIWQHISSSNNRTYFRRSTSQLVDTYATIPSYYTRTKNSNQQEWAESHQMFKMSAKAWECWNEVFRQASQLLTTFNSISIDVLSTVCQKPLLWLKFYDLFKHMSRCQLYCAHLLRTHIVRLTVLKSKDCETCWKSLVCCLQGNGTSNGLNDSRNTQTDPSEKSRKHSLEQGVNEHSRQPFGWIYERELGQPAK